MPAGELIRQFECVGDTKGDEAGIKAGVRAHFNPIKIEVETSEVAYKTIQVDPTPKFVPSQVGGDRDFGGHGPQVGVPATIGLSPRLCRRLMPKHPIRALIMRTMS